MARVDQYGRRDLRGRTSGERVRRDVLFHRVRCGEPWALERSVRLGGSCMRSCRGLLRRWRPSFIAWAAWNCNSACTRPRGSRSDDEVLGGRARCASPRVRRRRSAAGGGRAATEPPDHSQPGRPLTWAPGARRPSATWCRGRPHGPGARAQPRQHHGRRERPGHLLRQPRRGQRSTYQPVGIERAITDFFFENGSYVEGDHDASRPLGIRGRCVGRRSSNRIDWREAATLRSSRAR